MRDVCPYLILKITHCNCSKDCVHQSCGCRQLNITSSTDNCNFGKSYVPCKNVRKELVPISDDEIEIEEDIGNDIYNENENIRDARDICFIS